MRRARRTDRTRGVSLFAPAEHDQDTRFDAGIVAGIDEAGLGPLLGPLAVGLSAFRVPRGVDDLWIALEPAVSRAIERDRERLVVADSKVVFQRTPRGAWRLETTVLGFDALRRGAFRACGSPRELLETASGRVAELSCEAWYPRLPRRLCREHDERELEARVALLARTARAAGVELVAFDVRALPPCTLNASFASTDNKSATHWHACAPLIAHAWEHFALEGLALVVDRHGGRMRYRALLEAALPSARVTTLVERPVVSEYEIDDREGRRMRIAFVEKGETHSFAVALASCLAKYAREVCMAAFNAYFAELQPGLAPTAGYVQDGRRWLEDARVALERSGLPLAHVVRGR